MVEIKYDWLKQNKTSIKDNEISLKTDFKIEKWKILLNKEKAADNIFALYIVYGRSLMMRTCTTSG